MSLFSFRHPSPFDDALEPRPRGRRLALAAAASAAVVAGAFGFVAGLSRAEVILDGARRSEGPQGPHPHTADHTAAREHGRGRNAGSPVQIPARGWKDIAWRTWSQIGKDRVTAIAAGATYYALLALFPAIAAAVAIYGLFTDPATIGRHFGLARDILPYGAADIIAGQVDAIFAKGSGTLGVTFAVGLALSLWSANSGTKALLDALNIAYDETERRSFLRLNAVSLAFTLGGLVFVVLALAAFLALPVALELLPPGPLAAWSLRIGRWILMIVLLSLALALLYRYGPDRREPKWRWVSVGSVGGAVAWVVASTALSIYAANFAHYDATYGSLGGVIGLMVWMWVSTIVILAGAELNAEVEHQTARDSTVGDGQPLGARHATMADTVGSAKG